MIARRSVWSDPRVVKLVEKFVPAADDCDALVDGKGPEHDLFHEVAEQGHYGGRTKPTSTRQGTYALAPGGAFLGSINTNDAGEMAAMLERALAKWERLPREERLRAADPDARPGGHRGDDGRYPEGGLVLRVFARDLPREKPVDGAWASAWNEDFAWFQRGESRSFVPEKLEAGARAEVRDDLVRRLARCTLLDDVRGQTEFFLEKSIVKARLATSVTKIDGDLVAIHLEGETRAVQKGFWPIAGFEDMKHPTEHERGIQTRLLGRATFDRAKGRFAAFELVALGTRWGATQYNVRSDDPGPAPIGWALRLAGDEPADRVAPAFIWAYGWKREAPRTWR